MKKINLKSLVKSKFFWGSIIVILLIATSTFYILKEREKALRIYTQKQLTETIDEKKAVENKLAETVNAKEIIEEELVAERERTLVLEKEVQEKEAQIKLTLDKLQTEITARRKAETQLIIVMRAKRGLEVRLSKFAKRPKTIELEKILIKPASVLVGNVLAVNKEYGFIVVDLGRANNLKLGDVLSVYRDDEFIGRVQVERVEERICAVTILPDWQDVEFKEYDKVRGI